MKRALSCAFLAVCAPLVLGGGPAGLVKDKNLETAIRAVLHESKAELKEDLLMRVYVLEATGKEIKDLAGLEKCKNLALLRLDKNKITDISALKELPNLQSLDLAENQIKDVAPLANDTRLQYLQLTNNQ